MGINSIFVPYFVMLISFIQCAKKLFAVMEKLSVDYLDLYEEFCQELIENQMFLSLCKMGVPLVLVF